MMVGGGLALAGLLYYMVSSDKNSAKGTAKDLEGRAKGKVSLPLGSTVRSRL